MGVVGNVYVRGNICDITGNEQNDCFLVRVEFIDELGMVAKGPFFGVSDYQGDFLVFTDPISKTDNDRFRLKLSCCGGGTEPIRPFVSTQGMDPENYL